MKPKIFIATPIAGFSDEKVYNNFRIKIKALTRKLDKNFSIISEILNISNVASYDSPSQSAAKDFQNIESSSIFVLIYPQRMPTSALVELGYALALKKRILIITTEQGILPYMLKELDKVYSNVQISYFPNGWDDVDDIIYTFVYNNQ